MDYKQFTYILKVAELQNITKAAEALYISQSALSHYISKLEDELQVTLFDRKQTPLALTDAGQLYVTTAKEILRELDQLNEGIKQLHSYQTGTLHIGMPKSRSNFLLPLIITDFIAKYPQITLKITEKSTSVLTQMLKDNKLDFIIVPDVNNTPEFHTLSLYTEELLLVANPKLLPSEVSTQSVINDFSLLKELPLIIPGKGKGIREMLDTLFQQFNIQPHILLETTRNKTAYRIAATGVGACIIPNITLELAKVNTPISTYSLTTSGIKWDIVVLHKKETLLTPPMQYFIDLIQAKLKNHTQIVNK